MGKRMTSRGEKKKTTMVKQESKSRCQAGKNPYRDRRSNCLLKLKFLSGARQRSIGPEGAAAPMVLVAQSTPVVNEDP